MDNLRGELVHVHVKIREVTPKAPVLLQLRVREVTPKEPVEVQVRLRKVS